MLPHPTLDKLRTLQLSGMLKALIEQQQLPVDHWHAYLGDPTLADAILDRLVHNAYRLHLKGESLRKTRTPLTATPVSQ